MKRGGGDDTVHRTGLSTRDLPDYFSLNSWRAMSSVYRYVRL